MVFGTRPASLSTVSKPTASEPDVPRAVLALPSPPQTVDEKPSISLIEGDSASDPIYLSDEEVIVLE